MANYDEDATHETGERISGFREAQLAIALANAIAQEEEERQLRELDDAIVGSCHQELSRIRAELGLQEES